MSKAAIRIIVPITGMPYTEPLGDSWATQKLFVETLSS